jgi:hypothetical protein
MASPQGRIEDRVSRNVFKVKEDITAECGRVEHYSRAATLNALNSTYPRRIQLYRTHGSASSLQPA